MKLSQELPHRQHLEMLASAACNAELDERAAWEAIKRLDHTRAIYRIHDARIEWAIAVTALLAWVRYGGES